MAHSTGSMVEIADEEGRGGGCPAADRAPTSRTLLTVLTVFSRVARIPDDPMSGAAFTTRAIQCPRPAGRSRARWRRPASARGCFHLRGYVQSVAVAEAVAEFEHRSSQCWMKCPAPSSKVMTPNLLVMPPTDDEHNDPKDRHCEGERITDAIVAHWVHFLRRPDQ